nr:CRISPR-associated helicase Cas3' [uncultured Marinobacter sp.]
MLKEYIAHAKQNDDGTWNVPHSLEDHLRDVSRLAANSASRFGSEGWGSLAGLWHDLGKYRDPFQKYIRDQTGYDRENAHVEQGSGRVTHSTAGATHAVEKFGPVFGHILAYIISGHHAGLPDWIGGRGALSFRLQESKTEYLESLLEDIPTDILVGEMPAIPDAAKDPDAINLWIRLIFSCLVDADFLDTEQYMSPGKAEKRCTDVTLGTISDLFFRHMDNFRNAAEPNPLNEIRGSILDSCLSTAELEPGIFSLTVPTGGGKTLSSLAFAMRHAEKFGKTRIVYAIPFTSIIEQNAKVFRDILGEDAVLEHHSNLDVAPSAETTRSRLATENWDAPLIVTTNVQLFQSMFASRTSKCRKLHNLVNSVIVLDEAQQLPRDFHKPITQAMRQMTEYFGVTWVLCTATQPELGEQRDAFDRIEQQGLGNIREIVPAPSELAQALKRVSINMPSLDAGPTSWDALSDLVGNEPCVLVIVNTRNNARDLFGRLADDGNNIHLSANMCAEHRSAIISHIRQRLDARRNGDDRPLRVISTQLIEAGVDVDFPVVYRAMAGLDSIAQSAGRCNREDRLDGFGRVEVFLPEQPAPPGFLRQGEQTTLTLLKAGLLDDPLSPESIRRYFSELNRKGNRDRYQICDLLKAEQTTDPALDISFRKAAEQFRLIDDNGIGVVVPYCPDGLDESPIHSWLEVLDSDSSAKWIYRKLQRFSVTLPESFAKKLEAAGALYPKAGQFVVEQSHYDRLWGIQPPDALFGAERMIIS